MVQGVNHIWMWCRQCTEGSWILPLITRTCGWCCFKQPSMEFNCFCGSAKMRLSEGLRREGGIDWAMQCTSKKILIRDAPQKTRSVSISMTTVQSTRRGNETLHYSIPWWSLVDYAKRCSINLLPRNLQYATNCRYTTNTYYTDHRFEMQVRT